MRTQVAFADTASYLGDPKLERLSSQLYIIILVLLVLATYSRLIAVSSEGDVNVQFGSESMCNLSMCNLEASQCAICQCAICSPTGP